MPKKDFTDKRATEKQRKQDKKDKKALKRARKEVKQALAEHSLGWKTHDGRKI